MNDILGLGAWQAARVNERSEIINELMRPVVTCQRIKKNKAGTVTTQVVMEITLLEVLLLYLIATYGPWANDLIKKLFENLADIGTSAAGGGGGGGSPLPSITFPSLNTPGPMAGMAIGGPLGALAPEGMGGAAGIGTAALKEAVQKKDWESVINMLVPVSALARLRK